MTKIAKDILDHIAGLGRNAKAAAAGLAAASTEQKNEALKAAASSLRSKTAELVAANQQDIAATQGKKPDSFVDRLKLDEGRIEAMAKALEEIAELPDPVGRKLAQFDRPNGLKIERVSVPIGVIGMVYESRPNVGADASALCLKSGNAIILRGGSESQHSTRIIVECMQSGLVAAGLPEHAVQTVGTTDRSAVTALLQAADYVDLVIPRGGRGLVELVRDQAQVPTLLHLDGNCHSYVHEAADIDEAIAVIRNAKLRRTGVCGATESVVVDEKIASAFIPKFADAMSDCELRGDAASVKLAGSIKPASDADWDTEYLDAIVSIKTVSGLEEGIAFVQKHSSGHTDAILTKDAAAAEAFLNRVDSAVVMHNASTQFSDGGEFGMGAEIGIATGKIHARGPVGLEQLTSYKYIVRGEGQTRP